MKYGLNSIRPLSVLNFVQKSNFLHTFCKKLHFYLFFFVEFQQNIAYNGTKPKQAS